MQLVQADYLIVPLDVLHVAPRPKQFIYVSLARTVCNSLFTAV